MIDAEQALYGGHFSAASVDYRGTFEHAKAQVQRRGAAIRLYKDGILVPGLDSAAHRRAITPVQESYVRRLLAITDAVTNVDQLNDALDRFEPKAYRDLGPNDAAIVLGPSAVFRASAQMWAGHALFASRGKSGKDIRPAADQMCDLMRPGGVVQTHAQAGALVNPPGDCDYPTDPVDSGSFYVSASGDYLVNELGDSIQVSDGGGDAPSWTSRFLSGSWRSDGAGAVAGATMSLMGCGEITGGACTLVATVLGGAGTTLGWQLFFSPPFDESGGSGGAMTTKMACPSGYYESTYEGAPVCKKYPV